MPPVLLELFLFETPCVTKHTVCRFAEKRCFPLGPVLAAGTGNRRRALTADAARCFPLCCRRKVSRPACRAGAGAKDYRNASAEQPDCRCRLKGIEAAAQAVLPLVAAALDEQRKNLRAQLRLPVQQLPLFQPCIQF